MVSKKYLLCRVRPQVKDITRRSQCVRQGAKPDPALLLSMPLIEGLAEHKDLSKKNLTDEISQEITRQIICKAKQCKIPSKKMGETSQ
jgi:hypothetical protein